MDGTEEDLKAELGRNLRLFFFDDDEIGRILSDANAFDAAVRRTVLALLTSFSNASANAVPKVLGYVQAAARELPLPEMTRWLRRAFDLLDARGLESTVSFLSRTGPEDLGAFRAASGLTLAVAAPRIQSFLRGVSGRDIMVRPDGMPHTDGEALYLPAEISSTSDPASALLSYRLAAAYGWAQMALHTLEPPVEAPEDTSPLESLVQGFDNPPLATDLYLFMEAPRLEGFLQQELPGLLHRAAAIVRSAAEERPSLDRLSPRTALVEALCQDFLGQRPRGRPPAVFLDCQERLREHRAAPRPDPTLMARLYRLADSLPGPYEPVAPVPFLGRLQPAKVSRALRERQEAVRKKLESLIDRIINLPPGTRRTLTPVNEGRAPARPPRPGQKYLLLKGRLVQLDEESARLLESGAGRLPGTLLDGSDLGGGDAAVALHDLASADVDLEEPPIGGITYDEWDHKRNGYRKDWCTLTETMVHPGSEPFVELTLRKYGGHVSALRRKFEALRTEPRILKRQRDGEDVDLDAVVEALADQRAGLPPREGLFTRVDRTERSIAVLFLLDMSGSTKGWVNKAEKEALVLMGEALESLRDSYAIYGFSGMTRNRSEFYQVKAFDEPYDRSVRRRIAGIRPKDYTRMGPPIRHATKLLGSMEARTRLLITLSDGKPEDYDAYKGVYGIEDTRMALIEAKRQGIHPFCITIDREAHTYLPHMYGEVNYTFIDDIARLPARITEIYRRLTT